MATQKGPNQMQNKLKQPRGNQTGTHIREGEMKQGLLQNPYIDLPRIMYGSQRPENRVSMSTIRSSMSLHVYLEECYEQLKLLRKERRETVVILIKSYPGKWIVAASSIAHPKIPPHPSRVDHLIVDQLREQAMVVSLLGKMERVSSYPLHANISSALDRHRQAIYFTKARREEEFVNTFNRQEDRDKIQLLATAVRDLCTTTRKSRTALWCALQMSLPKSTIEKLDEQGDSLTAKLDEQGESDDGSPREKAQCPHQ